MSDARYLDAERLPLPLHEESAAKASAEPAAEPTKAAPAPMARPSKKPPKQVVTAAAAAARTATVPNTHGAAADPSTWQSPSHPAYDGADPSLAEACRTRYKHWAPKVVWIFRFWLGVSKVRAILKEGWPNGRGAAAKQDRARRFFFAIHEVWTALEAISNSRHKSYYMHNFFFLLTRQIAIDGEIYQHGTAAIEFRGARITRQKVCWRSLVAGTSERGIKRGDKIEKFKQRYNSCPMQQLLRNICALEEKRHGEVTLQGQRLSTTGRAMKVKMEPSSGYQAATTEMMLLAMNSAAGMGAQRLPG